MSPFSITTSQMQINYERSEVPTRALVALAFSKISLSASRASQASLCSLSTVDQIANLLPSVQSHAMLSLA